MMRLLAIVGPTASGKTRLAVDVAHALRSEIISVDSRQVYRGLDIGAGKDRGEYRRTDPPVRVHMLDVADPGEVYSLFHYQRDCYGVLEDAAGRPPFAGGTPMVMAGGTGLYLESVIKGYRIPDVPEDPGLRAELMLREREELVDRLRKESPELAARTDLSSRKRVVRALEITSRGRSGPVRSSPPPPVAMEPAVFGITVERRKLRERIARRLDERLGQGLVDEVRSLMEGGLDPVRLTQLGLEYREVASYLTGRTSYDRMVADLRQGIYRFAKRQETWFHGMPRRGVPVRWIAPDDREAVLAGIRREGHR